MKNQHPTLHVEKLSIADLTPDPANARLHTQRNLEAIGASLKQFGQRTPIVVQKKDGILIIRKGNGTTDAAKALGWTEIAAVVIEEGDQSAVAYAIADNRAGELALWDEEVLTQLLETVVDDEELFAATGFLEGELDDLTNGWLAETQNQAEIGDYDEADEKYQIRINNVSHAEKDSVLGLIESVMAEGGFAEGWTVSVF